MLEKILNNRKKEVAQNKELYPVRLLEKSIYFESDCVSLQDYLRRKEKSGIIAEFKRKSPSKGTINQYADVTETTIGYMQAGASALSVLTEKTFFGGSDKDLIAARNANFCPILRKDFIFDDYQILESKSIGADAVLIIAACLEKNEIKKLYDLSRSLGLEVVFEIHSPDELDKIPGTDLIIGVNNRNLKSMEVNLETSMKISKSISKEYMLISESGLSNPEDIARLREENFSGFLIGESLMKTPKPWETLELLISRIKEISR
jgi:indole-3-glycerol phosphate synthase